MPSRPLKRVEFAISKVFYGITLKKLYTPPHKGGYGLIETGLQLQGHRAKVIYHVVTDDKSLFSAYMRLKFMHHMGTLALRNAHTSYQALEKKLGCTYIGCYNWEDFLFSRHRTSHLNLTFTAGEVPYLHAWDKHAPKTRALCLRPHSASATQLMNKVQALAQLSPEERKWCQAKNFASLSRNTTAKIRSFDPSNFCGFFLFLIDIGRSSGRSFTTRNGNLAILCRRFIASTSAPSSLAFRAH